MQILGFQKTTLLDYPGHLSATIFLGGCNFRCPFCHNASLVLPPPNTNSIPIEEVFNTLKKRKNMLEGICISGGEPTLHSELSSFMEKIRELGYLIKLDTNGYRPDVIQNLISKKLVNFIAMDIKNSKNKYHISTGIPCFDTTPISESISLLLEEPIDYEFRTTVVKEHHSKNDFIQIGEWIHHAKAYYLQPYKESNDILSKGLSSPELLDLKCYQEALIPFVKKVEIRG